MIVAINGYTFHNLLKVTENPRSLRLPSKPKQEINSTDCTEAKILTRTLIEVFYFPLELGKFERFH